MDILTTTELFGFKGLKRHTTRFSFAQVCAQGTSHSARGRRSRTGGRGGARGGFCFYSPTQLSQRLQ